MELVWNLILRVAISLFESCSVFQSHVELCCQLTLVSRGASSFPRNPSLASDWKECFPCFTKSWRTPPRNSVWFSLWGPEALSVLLMGPSPALPPWTEDFLFPCVSFSPNYCPDYPARTLFLFMATLSLWDIVIIFSWNMEITDPCVYLCFNLGLVV